MLLWVIILYVLSTITFLLLVHIKNSDNNRGKCFVLDTYGINLEIAENRNKVFPKGIENIKKKSKILIKEYEFINTSTQWVFSSFHHKLVDYHKVLVSKLTYILLVSLSCRHLLMFHGLYTCC